MVRRRALAFAFGLTLAGCGGSPSQPAAGVTPPPGALALASGCFGWPATEFSPSNRATVQTFLGAGDAAVDFTLRDVNGTPVALSSLLATRPVLLVHGAFT